MAVKLVFSPRANEALEAISDYISRDNPSAAADWLKTVKRRCNALREMPYSGRRHGRTFRVVQVGKYQIDIEFSWLLFLYSAYLIVINQRLIFLHINRMIQGG